LKNSAFASVRSGLLIREASERTHDYSSHGSCIGYHFGADAEQPKALIERSLLHTSAVADIMYTKFALGTPLYRQEADYKAQDMALDRSLMCRYLEEVGNAFGATVVHAMWEDAIEHARSPTCAR
jgi:transposase